MFDLNYGCLGISILKYFGYILGGISAFYVLYLICKLIAWPFKKMYGAYTEKHGTIFSWETRQKIQSVWIVIISIVCIAVLFMLFVFLPISGIYQDTCK